MIAINSASLIAMKMMFFCTSVIQEIGLLEREQKKWQPQLPLIKGI